MKGSDSNEEITIKITPKEIADLVSEVQSQQSLKNYKVIINPSTVLKAIRDTNAKDEYHKQQ